MNKNDLRRLKTFTISKTMLVGLLSLKGNLTLRMEGMPDDAVIMSASDSLYPGMVHMQIWSSTFPVVEETAQLPQLKVNVYPVPPVQKATA